MIPRTLEPEVMDTPEEAAEYDAMDHSAVNGRFVADFRASHGPCRGGPILDVGTGTARIPIELCRNDPLAVVVGVDLAPRMLAVGRANVETAGLADRITLEIADAKGMPYAEGAFEAVICNTIVHHIPDPAPVLDAMARSVAPGGTLFCRDLARPDSAEELERLVDLHAGAETPYARSLFADSLRAALTLDEVRAIVAELGLSADRVAMTSDRHWTWTWRRPIAAD